MKKIVTLLLVFILSLGITTLTVAEEDPYKIGVVINNLDEAQTTQWAARAHKMHDDYPEIEFVQMSAEGVLNDQISMVESLIDSGCDAVYIIPLDADGCAVAVEQAKEAGLIVGIGDVINTDQYDVFPGVSSYDLGAYMGRVIISYLEDNPDINLNAGLILGELGMAQTWDTKDGMMSVLTESGMLDTRITFLDEQTGNWKTDEAMKKAEDWLIAYPEMNCIVAQSDEMILGALQACLSAGVAMNEEMYLFGKDGSARGLEEVKNGNLAGTVYISHPMIGVESITNFTEFCLGNMTKKEAEIIDSDAVFAVVTADNIDEFLVRYDEEYAYAGSEWN